MIGGRRRGGVLAAIGLAVMLSGSPAAGAYLLQSGDTLEVSVLGHEALARRVVVDMDGQIFLPLLGEFEAAGKTLGDLRREVAAGYSGAIYRSGSRGGAEEIQTISANAVLVEIGAYRPIHVLGDVGRPGELAFRPGLSVLEAVAGAGGLGPRLVAGVEDAGALLRLRTQAAVLSRRIELDRAAIARLRADVRNMLPEAAEEAAGTEPAAEAGAVEEADAWTFARQRARALRDAQTATTLQQLRNRLDVLAAQEAGAAEAVDLDAERVETLEATAALRFVEPQTLLQARQALVLSTSRALEISAARGDIEVELARLDLSDRIADQLDVAAAVERIGRMEDALQVALLDLQGLSLQIAQLGASPPDLVAEPRFFIHRRGVEGGARQAAEAQTRLEPGDVVEVELAYRAAPADQGLD